MHFQVYVNFQTCLLEAFLPTDSIAYCSFLLYFFISFSYDILSDTHSFYNYLWSTYYVPESVRAQEVPKYVKQNSSCPHGAYGSSSFYYLSINPIPLF